MQYTNVLRLLVSTHAISTLYLQLLHRSLHPVAAVMEAVEPEDHIDPPATWRGVHHVVHAYEGQHLSHHS